tara:strand:- start:4663 stop:6282 length:1620 start_codon:yes stop_codon:yes gene_type:complete
MKRDKGSLGFLLALFSLAVVFVLRSVNAVAYFGQNFGGWTPFGYGFSDIVSMYYAYPGWFDFFIFLIMFVSIGKAVFGGKFEGKPAQGLAVSMGVALSLGLVLWEYRTGIFILEHSAIVVFFLASIGMIFGIYKWLKKMGVKSDWLAIAGGVVATMILWNLLAGYMGLSMFGMFGEMIASVVFYSMMIPLWIFGFVVFFYMLRDFIKRWKKEDTESLIEWIKKLIGFTTKKIKGITDKLAELTKHYKEIRKLCKEILESVKACERALSDLAAAINKIKPEVRRSPIPSKSKADLIDLIDAINRRLTRIIKLLDNANTLPMNEVVVLYRFYFQGSEAPRVMITHLSKEIIKIGRRNEENRRLLEKILDEIKNRDKDIIDRFKAITTAIDELKGFLGPQVGEKSVGRLVYVVDARGRQNIINVIIKLAGLGPAQREVEKEVEIINKEQEVVQQRVRNVRDLKQKYMAYVDSLYGANKPHKNNAVEEKRKHRRKRILQALQATINAAEKLGVEKDEFLSNKIGNKMNSPDIYEAKLRKRGLL